MVALETLTHAHFSAHLGEAFQLAAGAEPLALTLIEAQPLGAARPGSFREPFVLKFQSQGPLRFGQGVFSLKNERLGELELFLVQTAPDELEAIFN